MRLPLPNWPGLKQLSTWISVVALTLSCVTFYMTQIMREQSIWLLLSQSWMEDDMLILQAVISNGGNRPAVIPSVLLHGNIPGHGTFVIETLKAPLALNSESATTVLVAVPMDLSSRVTVPHASDVANFFLVAVGVYSDKRHYSTDIYCPVTFSGTRISKLECPRYIVDFEPIDSEQFLAPPEDRSQ